MDPSDVSDIVNQWEEVCTRKDKIIDALLTTIEALQKEPTLESLLVENQGLKEALENFRELQEGKSTS
jgi:hypothetical protein